jgi:hypothetical protein
MNDEAEHNQAMLERAQMLEDALRRGIAGVATDDDWDVIHFECGVTRRHLPETQN